jgi:diguanylate cyclase (GGDEF)-like protein/PAS domain S-box-containing protein
VFEQLINPQVFRDKVQELYQSEQESFDGLTFKDGRVFERLSRPFFRDELTKGRVWSFRDVTARKRIEDELRESERRTATILRLSPIVIGVSTLAEGRYTDVNDAFERVLGYSQAETIGKTSSDLNLWADDDTRPNILREIQAHGRVENLEIRLRRKSGEIFPALIFITPIALHDTPCLLTMMMDITARKQAEEQLRDTRDALQTIIHSSPLAILALDHEDHLTMWNPAAEAMFGWSDKQILGQANPTVPENKSKEYEALRQATINGMAFSNLDTLRLKKDGTQFPVSLSVAPLRGQQSQVIGRMHIIADITDRKKLQEELRQQATTDELTKVSNRRHFIELAQSEIKRAIRLKRPPAIALIDIDHFKQVNDTFGHATGDQALVAFTKICQKHIREIDVFARFGGDEFVLLMPETNQEQAYDVLERVRLALTAQPMHLDGKPVALTISSGIASLTNDQESFDMILSQADQALYRAKEAGRNNVVRFDKL